MTSPAPFHPQISIVGLGKVGRNLARYFHHRGLSLAALVTRSAPVQDIPAVVQSMRLQEIPQATDLIILCLPEAQIEQTAIALSKIDLKKDTVIAHTSGISSSESLTALSNISSIVGSFHPIQSFDQPDMDLHYLDGIACGIEGSSEFLSRATSLCETLGWKPLVVQKEQKTLYHAACVFAGNFVSEILSTATALFQRVTQDPHPESALLPMVRKIVEQLEREGSITLTGPASRKDRDAIRRHVESLEGVDENLSKLYRAISESIIASSERHTR